MIFVVLFTGVALGFCLNYIINIFLKRIPETWNYNANVLPSLFTGVAFLLLYIKSGISIASIKEAVLTLMLITAAFIDLRAKIIPDAIIAFGIMIGIFFVLIGATTFTNALAGMALGGGIMFLIALIPGAISGGDVKLMIASGIFLGLNKTVWAILVAFAVSAVVSLVMMISGKVNIKEQIPFGPFLAIGSFISLFTIR